MSTKWRLGDVTTTVEVGSSASPGSQRMYSLRDMLPIFDGWRTAGERVLSWTL